MVNLSVNEIITRLNDENIKESIKRPNSKWAVERIYEYVLLITPIPGVSVGASIKLPKYIVNSKSIIGFQDVENNLCFWFCLAFHFSSNDRIDRLKRKAQELYIQYSNKHPTSSYKGIDWHELSELERVFQINVNVYRLSNIDNKGELLRFSQNEHPSTLSLNLYSIPNTNPQPI